MLFESDPYNIIDVEFYEKYSTTRAKINQVIDDQAEMVCYYQYAFDSSQSVSVILLHKNNLKRSKIYHYGELRGAVIHKITFLKSS